MRISICIAIVTISATFVTARPLNEGAVAESASKIEWTDPMPSSSDNEMDTGPSNYKEFEHAADQKLYKDKESNNANLNQKATESTRDDDVDDKAILYYGQLDTQNTAKEVSDKNSVPSDTKYAFDIIAKPGESQAQEPHSDTTLMDAHTRNVFSKNEITSDTNDYANREEVLDQGIRMRIANNHDEQVLLPSIIGVKDEGQEVDARFDFFNSLDQALLDPYISGIDSDLNSEVYEMPVTETTTYQVATNGEIPNYKSLVAEQIRLAEEQIRIKHDELVQDQQQIDDLKRKIHHSATTTTTTTTTTTVPSDLTFSMEVAESGPDGIMYVQPTPRTSTVQQPGLGTSVTHQPPPTKTPVLETDQQELRAEQIVPSAVINNTPFYNLVQKQTDGKDYYQAKIKKGSASVSEAVDLVIPPHRGDTAFDLSNKLKLPNGSWTPSCKNVSKGLYCPQPDGQGSTIIECLGENVGFEFSCGKGMLCYSTGPFDVDCQKAQGFINDE
ncbi:hypothetical protein PS15m_002314 [Mucor circinelloides]